MSELCKMCSCGASNNAYAFICIACGASLMYIPAEEPSINFGINEECNKTPLARLECLSQPEFVFQLQDGFIIGRQGEADISPLEKSIYISGKHARFTYREGRWLIEHLSGTNATYVNGVKVITGNLQEIHDEDKITLANTSFLFREVIK